jgi:hypothetical protein
MLPSEKKRPSNDVKALVLISPEWTFKGLPIKQPLEHPVVQRAVSVLIIVGRANRKAADDAERIHEMLERYRPEPEKQDAARLKNLFLIPVDTKLQGTKMLNAVTKLEGVIAKFIELRLVNQEYAWRQRK